MHAFKEMNHNYQSLSDNDVTLKVEDFVEVEYNGKRYAGEVKLIGEEDVQVSVLHRHFSQNWKWPASPLFFFYKYSNVLRKLCTPVGTGDRLSLKVKELV